MESIIHHIHAGATDLAREAIRDRLMAVAAAAIQDERISIASSMLSIDEPEETE